MADTASINKSTGNGVFDVVTVKEGLNLRGTLTTRTIKFCNGLTTSSNVKVNLPVITPTMVSSPDIERLSYASTSQNTPVVIPAFGVADGWDATTVIICTCPGSGALSSVDPVTGEITYTPTTGFSGTDVFRYTIVDNKGTLRTIFQYVVVFVPATPPFTNNAFWDLGNGGGGADLVNTSFSSFATANVVATDFPVDATSGVVVSATWDPDSEAGGGLTGPTDISTLAGDVDVVFLADGRMEITFSAAYRTEANSGSISTPVVGTYTFDDNMGNTSNVANFEAGTV